MLFGVFLQGGWFVSSSRFRGNRIFSRRTVGEDAARRPAQTRRDELGASPVVLRSGAHRRIRQHLPTVVIVVDVVKRKLQQFLNLTAYPTTSRLSFGTPTLSAPGKKVVRLEYEGYVPMAELELKKICVQVQ